MANLIDELMDLDPLSMTPDDISSIIDYHRRNRANHEAGVKPKKDTGPAAKIDLGALVQGMGLVKPEGTFKRRV